MTIKEIIDSHPSTCFRVLEQIILKQCPELNWQDDAYWQQLIEARPECGYDCDTRCPVSGKAESGR